MAEGSSDQGNGQGLFFDEADEMGKEERHEGVRQGHVIEGAQGRAIVEDVRKASEQHAVEIDDACRQGEKADGFQFLEEAGVRAAERHQNAAKERRQAEDDKLFQIIDDRRMKAIPGQSDQKPDREQHRHGAQQDPCDDREMELPKVGEQGKAAYYGEQDVGHDKTVGPGRGLNIGQAKIIKRYVHQRREDDNQRREQIGPPGRYVFSDLVHMDLSFGKQHAMIAGV